MRYWIERIAVALNGDRAFIAVNLVLFFVVGFGTGAAYENGFWR